MALFIYILILVIIIVLFQYISVLLHYKSSIQYIQNMTWFLIVFLLHSNLSLEN